MKNQKKIDRKLTIGIFVAVIIAVIAGMLVYNNLPTTRLRRQLDLGNKYLAELNYEQAIATFTKALEIAPDDSEIKDKLAIVYIAWADELIEAGDTDRALSILNEGYNLLNDRRLKDKIEELTIDAYTESEPSEESEANEGGITWEQSKAIFEAISALRDYEVLGRPFREWDYESMAAYLRDNAVESGLTGTGNPDRESWILDNGISGDILLTHDLVDVVDGNNHCYYQFQREGFELGNIVCYEANPNYPIIWTDLNDFFAEFDLTIEDVIKYGQKYEYDDLITYSYSVDRGKSWSLRRNEAVSGYDLLEAWDNSEKYESIRVTITDNRIETIMLERVMR